MDRRSGFLLGRILAVAGVGVAAAVVTVAWYGRCGCHRSTPILEDVNNLRQIAGMVAVMREFPARDGFLEPNAFVRNGDITGANLNLFRSNRLGRRPTDAEIERGDYTNFPWERYRGDGKLGGAPFPLLWEKARDKSGGLLVALSDGSVRYCDRAEAERLLAAR